MNVPCPLCGDPIDRALRDAGFTTHPVCDPREVSAQWPPETAGDPATLPRAPESCRLQEAALQDQETRA